MVHPSLQTNFLRVVCGSKKMSPFILQLYFIYLHYTLLRYCYCYCYTDFIPVKNLKHQLKFNLFWILFLLSLVHLSLFKKCINNTFVCRYACVIFYKLAYKIMTLIIPFTVYIFLSMIMIIILKLGIKLL